MNSQSHCWGWSQRVWSASKSPAEQDKHCNQYTVLLIKCLVSKFNSVEAKLTGRKMNSSQTATLVCIMVEPLFGLWKTCLLHVTCQTKLWSDVLYMNFEVEAYTCLHVPRPFRSPVIVTWLHPNTVINSFDWVSISQSKCFTSSMTPVYSHTPFFSKHGWHIWLF